ncbi:cysteine dioxygenase family protein [Orrella sp. JC864]|uniref:cysteine dioxygenase family protein n=1 Tax=Orrella sp. JC864 TaxID=3120298 RepID=UPI003008BF98
MEMALENKRHFPLWRRSIFVSINEGLSMLVQPSRSPFPQPPALAALIEALRQADAQAPAAMLPDAIGRVLEDFVPGDPAQLLLPHQCRGDGERYARHLLYAHPQGRFSVVALVWQPGQYTPVHGHYTWCAYAVLQGALLEERFEWDAGQGCAHPAGWSERPAGSTACAHAGLLDIHRLRNAGRHAAISLHVYGVDGERVATHVNRLAPPGPGR